VALASKLQIKAGQSVAVISKPEGVELDLEGLAVVDDPESANAVILFCADREQLEQRRDQLVAATEREALAWVAYPKAGQLGTDLNRDSLAEIVRALGIRPVRQISIDDVWSALRMRTG
jgi:hypothetical protein